MSYARTMNFEARVNEIKDMLNRGTVKELLKYVFTGCEEKEDRFPIVLNGVKLFMTYNEVRKNKLKFKLKYTMIGNAIKNRNFNEMLKLHNNGDLNLNKIRELMKEADTYREFVSNKKYY